MLIFGAVSLASRINCLGSKVRTTISPDFCTARNAAAVLESYRFWTVSIWRKTSSDIPVGWKYFESFITRWASFHYDWLVAYRANHELPFCTHPWDVMGGGGQNCSSYFDLHGELQQQFQGPAGAEAWCRRVHLVTKQVKLRFTKTSLPKYRRHFCRVSTK